MIIPAPISSTIKILGIDIYFYGIIMAIAILFAVIISNKLLNCYHKNVKINLILDNSPIIIIFGILGARLYFCLLNYHYYIPHFQEIFNIRTGGLSIHGALIGGILSIIYIAKKNNINILKILDCLCCGTILGQAIGRWGNYFNSEAYGLPTGNQNWGLYIPFENRIEQYSNFSLFHPTFLYESILDLITFLILLFVLKKFHKLNGLTFFLYLIFYSTIRFFIEQIRIDSTCNVGNIPIAIIISVILFIIGIIGLITVIKRK